MNYERLFSSEGHYTDLGNEVDSEVRQALRGIFKRFPQADVRDLGHMICIEAMTESCGVMIDRVKPKSNYKFSRNSGE